MGHLPITIATSLEDILGKTILTMMYDMPPAPHYVCNGCTAAEVRTVEFLQGRGIKDKYALATVMGNIRQESGFHANICEEEQELLSTSASLVGMALFSGPHQIDTMV